MQLPKTNVDEQWSEWCKDKKFAFLSPYQCPFGQFREDIVNGCTGFPTLFGGADFYWYPDLKDLEDFDFLKKYTHMFINVYPEYFHVVKKIKEKVPELKILGITDIQTHVLAYWSLEDTKLFVESINLYDYIFCTNADEVAVFSQCLRENKGRCQYTGWPMYYELTHTQNIIDPKNKDVNLIALGISNPGGFNRDLLANLAVWKQLKERFKDLKAFMYYVTPNKKEEIQEIINLHGCKDIELVDELGYDKAIEYLSQAFLSIHMYTFKVVGRLAQDCAALGIPTIGTIANLPNRLCFPRLSVNDYDVDAAVEIATEVLMSPYVYNKLRDYALHQVKFYSVESTKQRVLKVLNYDK